VTSAPSTMGLAAPHARSFFKAGGGRGGGGAGAMCHRRSISLDSYRRNSGTAQSNANNPGNVKLQPKLMSANNRLAGRVDLATKLVVEVVVLTAVAAPGSPV